MRMRVNIALMTLVLLSAPALGQELSTSLMRPTAVDPQAGLVAGPFPGGGGSTSYYVAAELDRGELVTQLIVAGRPNTLKRVDFELLNANARVSASYYVSTDVDAKREATKTFAIDSSGRHVIRLIVDGSETGTFCVLLGGSALPNAKPGTCPPPKAAAAPPPPPPPVKESRPVVAVAPPPPPPPPSNIQVIESRCEQRLRIGSDILFDFDRAELRPEAGPTIDQLSGLIAQRHRPALVEGHTDAIGTESYNQTLSERRASAVQRAISQRSSFELPLRIRGFGKSRPVAANQRPDGSDDPEGRQRNRRVEVVINTCS